MLGAKARPGRGSAARDERGVTLIELILSIVIVGIIGIVAAQAFFFSTKSVLTGNAIREATQVNRIAIDRMVREIRGVFNNTSVVTANATTFEFVNAEGKTVRFQFSSPNLNRTFTDPPAAPVTNVLASNVSAMTFTYLDNTGGTIAVPLVAPSATDIWWIQIALTVGSGSETVVFRSRVHPRSF